MYYKFMEEFIVSLCTFYSDSLISVLWVWIKVAQLTCYSATYNPGQRHFYNLGSGSWLALAVVPRRKLAAAHCPR